MENFKGGEDVLAFGEPLIDVLSQTGHIFHFQVGQSLFV